MCVCVCVCVCRPDPDRASLEESESRVLRFEPSNETRGDRCGSEGCGGGERVCVCVCVMVCISGVCSVVCDVAKGGPLNGTNKVHACMRGACVHVLVYARCMCSCVHVSHSNAHSLVEVARAQEVVLGAS